MLTSTLPPSAGASADRLTPLAYACTHTAFPVDGTQGGYWLSRYTAPTPSAALQWLHRKLWETAAQLDDSAQRIAEDWMTDVGAQRVAARRLDNGLPVTFALVDDQARYEVSVCPPAGAINLPRLRTVPVPVRRRHATPRRPSRIRRLAYGLGLPAFLAAGVYVALLRWPLP
ncbi:hypothetical protein [Streptacidiphilus neutrinimicus]|uniref:hypothetical protein n=1 Tax=Streptacidiphilus neutrinimicus TaxID=105420 RepID=UPI0005A7FB19|nr:hypothetical protein [Streptacidiphilus neutrinimicus]